MKKMTLIFITTNLLLFSFSNKLQAQRTRDNDFYRIIESIFPSKIERAIKNAIVKGDFNKANNLIEREKTKNEKLYATAHLIVKGLYYEKRDRKKEACDCYRNAFDTYPKRSKKEKKLLDKYQIGSTWLTNKVFAPSCIYLNEIFSELSKDRSLCNCLKVDSLFTKSKKIRENIRFKKTFTIAEALQLEKCYNPAKDVEACAKYLEAKSVNTTTKQDNDILVKYGIDNLWIEAKLSNCTTKNKNKAKQMLVVTYAELTNKMLHYKDRHKKLDSLLKYYKDSLERFHNIQSEHEIENTGNGNDGEGFKIRFSVNSRDMRVLYDEQSRYGIGIYRDHLVAKYIESFTNLVLKEHIENYATDSTIVGGHYLGTADAIGHNRKHLTVKYLGDIEDYKGEKMHTLKGKYFLIKDSSDVKTKNYFKEQYRGKYDTVEVNLNKGEYLTCKTLAYARAVNALHKLLRLKEKNVNPDLFAIYVHDYASQEGGDYRKVEIVLYVEKLYKDQLDQIKNMLQHVNRMSIDVFGVPIDQVIKQK